MKILYLAPGNSIHSKKWIEKIKTLHPENSYYWYSFEKYSYQVDESIKYFYCESKLRFKFFKILYFIFQIYKVNFKTRFDLIHIHSVGTYGLFSIIPILFKVPFIITPWGSDIIFGSKKFINRIIIKFILSNANLITCDAIHISNLIKKILPEAKPKIINFGIDACFFKEINKNKLKNNILKIISTRNHENIYDLDTLIKASKKLKDNNINFALTIASEGSQTKILKKTVFELGLSNQIKFIGRYQYENLPELINNHDIYISTSLSDAGIASSIAEAMACQKIVIISDSGENKSWISNNLNGFLFKSGSSQSLYNSIIEVIDHKNHWEKIGINARETILERNDINNEMKKMYQLMTCL